MAEGERIPGGFAVLITRVAAVWVLVGACLKLFLGTPLDLPRIVQQLPLDLQLTFQIAIAAELTVGILALLKPRWAWLLLMTLLILFDVALITQMRDGAQSCGCFGADVTVPPIVVLVIDSLLILLIVVSRPWASLGRDGIHALALTMLLVAVVPLPWLFDRTSSSTVFRPYHHLQVAAWQGMKLAETELAKHVELEKYPADGLWIFYRDTCPLCADLLEVLVSQEFGLRPLVLVHLPDAPDEEAKVHTLPSGEHVHFITLPDDVDWLVTGPPEGFVLRDGCVTWARTAITFEIYQESLDPPIPDGCK